MEDLCQKRCTGRKITPFGLESLAVANYRKN